MILFNVSYANIIFWIYRALVESSKMLHTTLILVIRVTLSWPLFNLYTFVISLWSKFFVNKLYELAFCRLHGWTNGMLFLDMLLMAWMLLGSLNPKKQAGLMCLDCRAELLILGSYPWMTDFSAS